MKAHTATATNSTMDTRQDRSSWAILGVLRFFLALVVACNHYYFIAPFGKFLPTGIYIFRLLGGWTAVISFFLVSGFSIAASCDRSIEGFYSRRFKRLAPVYFTCLIYSMIPWLFMNGVLRAFGGTSYKLPSPLFQSLLGAFVGVPMLIAPVWINFGVSWSLTCEIIYYALSPHLYKSKSIILCLIIVLSFIPWVIADDIRYPLAYTWLSASCLLWIWLAGFLFYRYRMTLIGKLAIALTGFTAIIIHPAIAEHLAPLCMGITVFVLCWADKIKLPGNIIRFGDSLGDISYPLYLSHLTTYFLLYRLFPNWLPSHSVIYVSAAIVIAIGMHNCVEIPIRRRIAAHSRRAPKVTQTLL